MTCQRVVRRVASLACAVFACIVVADLAWSDVAVSGYTRRNGTYVPPHYRSSPDGNFSNNWSTRGNQNPHTGEWGTKTRPSGGGYSSESSYRGPGYSSRSAEAASRYRANARAATVNGLATRQGQGKSLASDDPLETYVRPDRRSGIEGAVEITNPYVVTTPPSGAVLASIYWGEEESYEPIDLPSMEPSSTPLVYANITSAGSPQQIADRIDTETRQRIAKELTSRGLEVNWENKSYDDLLKLLKAM